MKNILYIFIACLVMLTSFSCDRMDDNGPFEGYWHLVSCEGGTSSLAPNSDITWGVRNELIQMNDLRGSLYYYCTFRRTDHQLELLEAFENDGTNDTKIELSMIPAQFWIPDNGKFEIIELNSHRMVIKSPKATLHFKKN